jgi:Flp pilus assembly pilin Flp
MLVAYVWIQSLVLSVPVRTRSLRFDQRGQASAEYALVLLGAAAVALLVMAWATRTNRIGRLLDAVMDQLMNRVR